MQEKL
jgi:hypothetical protein